MPRHNLAVVDATPQGSAAIERLAAKYKAVCAEFNQLKAAKEQISDKLLKAAKDEAEPDAEGKLRLETDNYKLLVVGGKSADAISATELLRLGVRPSVIKKATVEGTKYEYVRVDARKGE